MQARIGTVAELYDVISRSATLGPVPAVLYLKVIAGSLLGGDGWIGFDVAAEPLSVGADHAVTLGLVVNELATNAAKYAFPDGVGCTTLGFARRDGEVFFTLADDRVGLATGGPSPALGLGSRFA